MVPKHSPKLLKLVHVPVSDYRVRAEAQYETKINSKSSKEPDFVDNIF